MSEEELLVLQSKDGRVVTVQKSIATISETLVHLLEGTNRNEMTPIPLYQVDYDTLKRLVAWMTWYKQSQVSEPGTADSSNEMSHDGKSKCIYEWERNHFECLERLELFALMNAANYLEVTPLSQSSAAFVAEKLQSMSVEEVRQYLNLKNDFTDEELEQLRKETSWANK